MEKNLISIERNNSPKFQKTGGSIFELHVLCESLNDKQKDIYVDKNRWYTINTSHLDRWAYNMNGVSATSYICGM